MIVYYRISDGGYSKDKLEFATKEKCLENFLSVFPNDEIVVFGDNINEVTEKMVKSHTPNLIRIQTGSSAQSFRYVFLEALKILDDNTVVLFQEEDYLYTSNARNVLLEGLSRVDYVSGYDHLDKYINGVNGGNPLIVSGGEETLVFTTESHHWKLTNSTTMTFMTKVGTLREDKDIFLKHTEGTYPTDFQMWLDLREKGRALATPIPGVSTHIETRWLSPNIDWKNINHGYK